MGHKKVTYLTFLWLKYQDGCILITVLFTSSKAPIFEMVGHEDKVLCVDWSIKNMILTGSADNTFKIYATADTMN
jgi:WD40 repeat protein